MTIDMNNNPSAEGKGINEDALERMISRDKKRISVSGMNLAGFIASEVEEYGLSPGDLARTEYLDVNERINALDDVINRTIDSYVKLFKENKALYSENENLKAENGELTADNTVSNKLLKGYAGTLVQLRDQLDMIKENKKEIEKCDSKMYNFIEKVQKRINTVLEKHPLPEDKK